ncbi:MAG: hypothetical protein IKX76_01415, partial [Eubacterium sp.]|nr:hypothetical protein [Eubacterium sp.]
MADEENKKQDYTVGGFEFISENDAQKGQMDLSKIKVLESRIKTSRPNEMKAVYEKAIENKIFKTPIGWGYLMDLRKKLLASGFKEEDLIPIPLNVSITRHSAMENLTVRQRIIPDTSKKESPFKRIFPIVLNIVLAILVVVMFLIAASGENDN